MPPPSSVGPTAFARASPRSGPWAAPQRSPRPLAPLRLSAEGSCGFDHPDGFTVVLEVPDGGDPLFLHGVATRLPERDAEPLLALNLAGRETGRRVRCGPSGAVSGALLTAADRAARPGAVREPDRESDRCAAALGAQARARPEAARCRRLKPDSLADQQRRSRPSNVRGGQVYRLTLPRRPGANVLVHFPVDVGSKAIMREPGPAIMTASRGDNSAGH